MNVQRHQDIRNRKRKQRRTDAATHTQKFSEPFFFLSLLISASSSFFFFFSILTDLDSVVVSREEQKTAIIPPVDVGMENLPLPPFSSSLSNPSSSAVNDNSPSTESRLLESTNWYDDGSIATCIDQTSPQIPSRDLREISNEQILPQVNLSNAQDEFFLFSPLHSIGIVFLRVISSTVELRFSLVLRWMSQNPNLDQFWSMSKEKEIDDDIYRCQ